MQLIVKIVKSKSVEKICQAITELESTLVPSLLQRGIDINCYAEKLSENAEIFLAEDELHNVVGIVAAYINDIETNIGYISFIAVHNRCQRQGVGKSLLEKVECAAKAVGMHSLRLEVWYNNRTAICFYEKMGFEVQGQATEDSLYYQKRLMGKM